MAKEILRAYTSSDDYMLETSDTIHALFNINIADFTAFDSNLDATFSSNWLTKINAARTVVRDSQIKDVLAEKTEIVLSIMENCRQKYIQVKYFAIQTFPNSSAKQSEFGIDTYKTVRTNQSKMILFLDEMHKACVKYQTELNVAGLTDPQIDEIITLRDTLLEANTNQESYTKGRPVLTQDRILALNECYLSTKRVVDAAHVVYYNDYARKNQFVFGSGNDSGSGSNSDLTITGLISNALNAAPIGAATIIITSSLGSYNTTTDPLGNYSVVIQLAETEDCLVSINAINFQPFSQTSTINPDDATVLNFSLTPN